MEGIGHRSSGVALGDQQVMADRQVALAAAQWVRQGGDGGRAEGR